ncbi:MAG: hypothetical protein ACREFA_02475 [Stellaceae bacterium]
MNDTTDPIDDIAQEYRTRSLAEGGGSYAIAYALLLICQTHGESIDKSLDYIGNMLGDICAAVS